MTTPEQKALDAYKTLTDMLPASWDNAWKQIEIIYAAAKPRDSADLMKELEDIHEEQIKWSKIAEKLVEALRDAHASLEAVAFIHKLGEAQADANRAKRVIDEYEQRGG